MEKMFTEPKVREIIDKVLLDGKIISTKHYINYLESLLKSKKEWFEHLNEREFMSENWFECNGEISILNIVKQELEETLKLLEEKKANK